MGAPTFVINDQFPDGFFEAYSKVMIEFGRGEYLLKLVVKRLSGKGFDEGFYEAENIQIVKNLCEKAKKRFAEKHPAETARQQQFGAVLDDFTLLWGEHRNDFTHCIWTATDDGQAMFYRPKLDKEKKEVDWDRSALVSVAFLKQLHARLVLVRSVLNAATN